MPKNLDERPGTFPRQRAIVAGDPRGADLYEACLQDAADRTAYLKERIEHVDPDGMGVRRLRRVASFADLRTLTDHPDGSIIVVGVIGLYQFFAESTLDELEHARERGVRVGRRGEDLVDVGRERPPALRGRQRTGDAHRGERSAGRGCAAAMNCYTLGIASAS